MKLFVINGKINPHLHDPTWHWLTLNQWLVGPRSNNCSQVFVFCLTWKTNLKSGRRQTLCNNSSSHCVYLILIGRLNPERVGLFLLQFTTWLRFICVKYSFTLTAEWRGCCLLVDLKEWMVSVLVAEMQYPPVLLCVVFLRSALEDFLCLWSQPQEAKRTLLAAWRELPTTGRTSLVWCAGRRWTPPAL